MNSKQNKQNQNAESTTKNRFATDQDIKDILNRIVQVGNVGRK